MFKKLKDFIKRIFGMNNVDQNENEANFQRAAYHESGHIALAYLSGYSCIEVRLDLNEPGNGATAMHYNDDLMVLTWVTNYAAEPNFINNINADTIRRGIDVANRSARILTAGSVAECTYINGGLVSRTMEIEVSGPDLSRVENVHLFLMRHTADHDPNFVQAILQEVLQMMMVPEVWRSIDHLAQRILLSPEKRLNRVEIESSLRESGYLEFVGRL